MRAPCSPTRCSLFQPSAFCCSRCCLSPQQLLRLQEELKGKELELEQARDEQRYLEGEVLSLREKVGQTSWPFLWIIWIYIHIIVLFEGPNNDYEEQCWGSDFEAAATRFKFTLSYTTHLLFRKTLIFCNQKSYMAENNEDSNYGGIIKPHLFPLNTTKKIRKKP